jgi:hypothetical protein
MKIKDVKTAIKVGDFILRKNSRNKIDIKYSPNIDKKILTDDSARIYLITKDEIIKKIGGSIQRGGIKGTVSFYTGAMTGSPGRPRFILHLLIEEALKSGSKVTLYMVISPKTLAMVNGLFGSKKMKIASFKEMEDSCKSDYYSREKKYPDWNFQENHQSYPSELEKKFMAYHRKRLNKK